MMYRIVYNLVDVPAERHLNRTSQFLPIILRVKQAPWRCKKVGECSYWALQDNYITNSDQIYTQAIYLYMDNISVESETHYQ
jgi:hypothetical protein